MCALFVCSCLFHTFACSHMHMYWLLSCLHGPLATLADGSVSTLPGLLQLALSPSPRNPAEPIAVQSNQQLALKVEGVVQHGARPGLFRRIQSVCLNVSSTLQTKAGQDYKVIVGLHHWAHLYPELRLFRGRRTLRGVSCHQGCAEGWTVRVHPCTGVLGEKPCTHILLHTFEDLFSARKLRACSQLNIQVERHRGTWVRALVATVVSGACTGADLSQASCLFFVTGHPGGPSSPELCGTEGKAWGNCALSPRPG